MRFSRLNERPIPTRRLREPLDRSAVEFTCSTELYSLSTLAAPSDPTPSDTPRSRPRATWPSQISKNPLEIPRAQAPVPDIPPPREVPPVRHPQGPVKEKTTTRSRPFQPTTDH